MVRAKSSWASSRALSTAHISGHGDHFTPSRLGGASDNRLERGVKARHPPRRWFKMPRRSGCPYVLSLHHTEASFLLRTNVCLGFTKEPSIPQRQAPLQPPPPLRRSALGSIARPLSSPKSLFPSCLWFLNRPPWRRCGRQHAYMRSVSASTQIGTSIEYWTTLHQDLGHSRQPSRLACQYHTPPIRRFHSTNVHQGYRMKPAFSFSPTSRSLTDNFDLYHSCDLW